jgi:hypothetical protein
VTNLGLLVNGTLFIKRVYAASHLSLILYLNDVCRLGLPPPSRAIVGLKRQWVEAQDGEFSSLKTYMADSPFVLVTPSIVARPRVFPKHQSNTEERILNDCPNKDVQVTLIALQYHTFGQFLDHIHDRPEGDDDVDLTELGITVDRSASVMYQHMRSRISAGKTLGPQQDLQLLSAVPIASDRSSPNRRDRHTDEHTDGPAPVMGTIVEVKNELRDDADPEIQLTSYFAQMHRYHLDTGLHCLHKNLYDRLLFPALGILIIGRS